MSFTNHRGFAYTILFEQNSMVTHDHVNVIKNRSKYIIENSVRRLKNINSNISPLNPW